ncbi:unnamed protein product [Acanthoscelides obtectus]|uniref:Endonuclease/exonuclease/phosphatase domain-containing protein n=1 Tax=Acanthoscelides obtectus TaxID=200917 RepID=A0A9P0KGG3_ACAOB|nr:unnamed protein product [Acanthoscelides obtectus]CAK1632516.1 hypothetical protein AOBTE_LOCUS7607 [Acanthoscelides obtectus]
MSDSILHNKWRRSQSRGISYSIHTNYYYETYIICGNVKMISEIVKVFLVIIEDNCIITGIYRPNPTNVQDFVNNLDSYLRSTANCDISLLVGDINIDLLREHEYSNLRYVNMLQQNGYTRRKNCLLLRFNHYIFHKWGPMVSSTNATDKPCTRNLSFLGPEPYHHSLSNLT